VSGLETIAAAFAAARADGRAALMPYMMGGFPDLPESAAIGEAYADAGADLIELGVPYADPLADGPVIHAAGTRALAAGVRLAGVLELGASLAPRVPVVLMCYVNLILARGVERFADDLAAAGISGLIVPDLPLEEAPAVAAACRERGLALVPLVAPTTPEDRLRAIAAHAQGFVYVVSVRGTTGERGSLDGGLADLLERSRAAIGGDVPLAVGFGIGSPEQAAAAAAAGADGVIIGTRLVREAAEATEPAAAVGRLVGAFAAALRPPGDAG
jgi:tryptophan synthase alpha chain